MANYIKETKKEFKRRYKKSPALYIHSPGRICIIGEHVDYHDGFVMNAAIDLGIDWALSKNDKKKVRGFSLDTNEYDEFALNANKRVNSQWLQYLQGVVEILKEDGVKFAGVDLVIKADLPIGGGLSSSSSLTTGFIFALSKLYNLNLTPRDLTDIGSRAEWWYGTNGGNMDHFTLTHSKKDQGLVFDVRNFEFYYVPMPKATSIVIFETTVHHNQKFSPYAKRRAESEKALKFYQDNFPNENILKLCDVSKEMIEKSKNDIDEVSYRRALHIVTEDQRVKKAKVAFDKNNLKGIKFLMSQSHLSLKNNYEVSCVELDLAVDIANQIDDSVAAKMTGGGFGGCTINLIDKNKAEKFAKELAKRYKKITGLTPKYYICQADDGVREIKYETKSRC